MTDLQKCVSVMATALRKLDEAKEDCKTIIDSAFDLYNNANGTVTKKNLKKFAKSIAERKYTDLTDDIEEMKEIIDKVPGWGAEIPVIEETE